MTKPGKESVKSDSFSISLTQQLACFFRVHLLETGYCGLWIIVKYCEVLSVLLFVSGLAGVAIYYLRYCYHASLIGTVHNYAEPTVLHWSSNLAELKCDGDGRNGRNGRKTEMFLSNLS